MKIDESCLYTDTHEWIRVEGEMGTVGITDYAQEQLSDIVYVELPEVGDFFEKGEAFAVVESVKAAADCYMPVGGEVTEINEELGDSPQLVNEDPFGAGWFIEMKIGDPSELEDLMKPEEYGKFVAEEIR
jgi:glycine cleavage system H protein